MATRAGGTVRLESMPGQGITVVQTLRLARPDEPAKFNDVAAGLGDEVLRGTILVVDDDLEVREGLTASLCTLGHEVLEAGSGEEGLRVLEQKRVDAVLLDFAMPGIDGAPPVRSRSSLLPQFRWPALVRLQRNLLPWHGSLHMRC